MDHFRLTVASLPDADHVTKRAMISDIAKTFDVLGWFSPSTIKAKILLQRLWESKIGWDDLLPPTIYQSWLQWRSELHLLAERHIPRCYYPRDTDVDSMGFVTHPKVLTPVSCTSVCWMDMGTYISP